MAASRFFVTAVVVFLGIVLSGCQVNQKKYDYGAFEESRPASILVLPPLNSSPDINATYSVLSQVTVPLAESGYYVLPVALVDETFRQNGLTSPGDIHSVSPAKLAEIFDAAAALYIEITDYGTRYLVITSETRVTANAKLVDLSNGKELWAGEATASSAENRSNSGGGLAGLLIQAVVQQIIEDVTEAGHNIAGITSKRLLFAGQSNGILYGPRSPQYKKDKEQ